MKYLLLAFLILTGCPSVILKSETADGGHVQIVGADRQGANAEAKAKPR